MLMQHKPLWCCNLVFHIVQFNPSFASTIFLVVLWYFTSLTAYGHPDPNLKQTLPDLQLITSFGEWQDIRKHYLLAATGEISEFLNILYDSMWDNGNSLGPKDVHSYLTRLGYNRCNNCGIYLFLVDLKMDKSIWAWSIW